jgi:hypothetical protein
MIADQLIAMLEQAGGTLELTNDNRIHYRLPTGHEQLAEALCSAKEQIRSVLRDRQNAARPKRAPQQAPPPPAASEPVYITPACTCSKYPHSHVHDPNDLDSEPLNVIPLSGEPVWRFLKKQVTTAHEKSKNLVFDDYAFDLTQAMPPIVLDGPNAHCERPVEGIKPGESVEIMVDRHAVPRPKKTELSPWGEPKINGYAKYRWDDTPKASSTDSLAPWLLSIGVRVTAIENDWVLGWIEWRTRAIDCEYVYGRRVRFREYPSSRGEAHA